ncbi:hypothetical protein QBC39DRAFT_434726 [Podospora conica]|nr:hypothetical protein QBC39DRAFT_434726 [Schizothecium conicum]
MVIDAPLSCFTSFLSSQPQNSESFSVTIHNKSGGLQNYTLFSQPPEVKPTAQSLTARALFVAKGVASPAGSTTFDIPSDELYAICGTMHADVSVVDRRLVKLGSSTPPQPGTTCVVDVVDGTPSFGLWGGAVSDMGKEGAFCVKTTAGFTLDAARSEQYFVGLGLAQSPSTWTGLYASFIPGPLATYQITPSKVFYIVPAAFRVNQPMPSEGDISLNNAFRIDFALTPPDVDLLHNGDNLLSLVAKDSDLLLRDPPSPAPSSPPTAP